jgi:hypothetical protein
MKKIKNFFFYSFIFFSIYFFICILFYTLSGFAVINGKIVNFKIITDYQRNFYHQLGFRKIWQYQTDCVQYDKDLIFKPSYKECIFNNIEFDTKLNFYNKGRIHNLESQYLIKKKIGVAVLGDSHAMGWGVNDDDTFSAILEKKIKRPVYNLGVSGYATNREILLLKKSGVLDLVDTIIIQYCNNDYQENVNFHNLKNENNFFKFEKLKSKEISPFARLRKGIRYAVTIPLQKNIQLDWKNEETAFLNIINNYDFLKKKKIIVIYSNGHEIYYNNFKLTSSYHKKNISLLNIDYAKDDFYLIDGHLSKQGHLKVADALYNYLLLDK